MLVKVRKDMNTVAGASGGDREQGMVRDMLPLLPSR